MAVPKLLLMCRWCLVRTIVSLGMKLLVCKRVADTTLVSILKEMFNRRGSRARQQAAMLPLAKVPRVTFKALKTSDVLFV